MNRNPAPTQIHTINAYSNVFVEVAKEELHLSDGEVQIMLREMHQTVSRTLKMSGIDYADLKSALTPSSGKREVAFIFDSDRATNSFYGEEFAHVWLAAMKSTNGPMRTAILEGDVFEPHLEIIQPVINKQLELKGNRDRRLLESGQYFVVYFSNVSSAQLESLDYEMYTRSEAYLGFLDCSGRNSFKLSLLLPQVALRIDSSVITVQDEVGTANIRGYPFEEFGFKIVGVDELIYGTFLEFRIDNGVSHWADRDSATSIAALSGFMRNISSMALTISEERFKYLISEKPGYGHGASINRAGLGNFNRYELARAIKKELDKGLLYSLRSVDGAITQKDGTKISEPKNDALMFSVQVEFLNTSSIPQRYQVGIKYNSADHSGEVVTMYG